jgi:hypothetical protein
MHGARSALGPSLDSCPPLADNGCNGVNRDCYFYEADRPSIKRRIIYYWAVRKDMILLLYAYQKNAAENLSPKQDSQLAKVVKEEFGNEKTDV